MNCLEEYLKIFEQYPLNNRRFKKERHIALQKWSATVCDVYLLKIEICNFIKMHFAVINKVFIEKIGCPLFEECLKIGDYDYLTELIEAFNIIEPIIISQGNIINIYCEYIHREKTPIQILDEILLHKESLLLLNYKYEFLKHVINYSIHELPWGLLEYEPALQQSYLDLFSDFKEVATKLNKQTNIDKIKKVYEAYYDYLKNNNVSSFEKYLRINNIDYDISLSEKN